LAEVWDGEIVPILKSAPGFRAIAVLEEIRRRHPEIATGIRRTLERRMRTWRALVGPELDVIFRQERAPGVSACQTSPTRAYSTVSGVVQEHWLYHFRLTSLSWSRVGWVSIMFSSMEVTGAGQSTLVRGRCGPFGFESFFRIELTEVNSIARPQDALPVAAVVPDQPDDSNRGPEALLGVGALAHDDLDQRRGVAPDLAGLPPDPLRFQSA
jgi:hypothetical protein